MGVHITYRGQSHIYDLPQNASVASLKDTIRANLQLSPSLQKLLYKGQVLQDNDVVPSTGKIMLVASSLSAIEAVKTEDSRQSTSAARRKVAAGTITARSPSKTFSARDAQAAQYSFGRISVLTHLPQSSRSLAFLQRLSNDAAIKKVMIKHHYKVQHLTEMDPRLNTSHDSKLLGLNKNFGEEITLRLRTDTLDGWRDYKTVRATLVHELVHNEVGDHPPEFWRLFDTLSKEVVEHEGGQRVGDQRSVYIPEEAKHCDSCLTRETRQLAEGTPGPSGGGRPPPSSESLRELRAKAAERRYNDLNN